MSIKKNTKDILIPSEEHKISMFPMDFEEFLWAIGDEVSAETIRYLIKNKKAAGRYKLFNSDVGLFITLAFKDKKYTENIIYNKLLSDKLDVNLGYVYENVVAQMLIAKGNNLFYYTMKSETSNHLYEIDFLTSVKDKICPLEVKSGNYRTHKSLDAFCNKFSNRIGSKYVVHTKDYKWENGIYYIPMYMVPFL